MPAPRFLDIEYCQTDDVLFPVAMAWSLEDGQMKTVVIAPADEWIPEDADLGDIDLLYLEEQGVPPDRTGPGASSGPAPTDGLRGRHGPGRNPGGSDLHRRRHGRALPKSRAWKSWSRSLPREALDDRREPTFCPTRPGTSTARKRGLCTVIDLHVRKASSAEHPTRRWQCELCDLST